MTLSKIFLPGVFFFISAFCSDQIFAQTNDYLAEYAKGYRGGFISGQESVDNALEFAVIGDWGRGGEYFQKDIAEQLAKAVTGINASFIISTGDNIYPDGVQSVNDPLWRLSFEDLFYQYPLHRPWYAILGNHDYHQNAQAEIDYSQVSGRWNMPAHYYSFKKLVGGEEVLFLFIDTTPLEPDSHRGELKIKLEKQDTLKQKHWIEKTLADNAGAKWKIVIGHHPLYTAGNRALNIPYMRSSLEHIFERHKVDLYISGHEHHLQYYHPDERYTHHFISGAGSEANESLKPRGQVDFFAPIQGFMTFSVTPEKVLMQAINKHGEVLKKITIVKSSK